MPFGAVRDVGVSEDLAETKARSQQCVRFRCSPSTVTFPVNRTFSPRSVSTSPGAPEDLR